MASTAPAKSQPPLHNFTLPHLKWNKDGNHQRRRSMKSPSQRPSSSSASPVRHSPFRDSVSSSPSRHQSPLRESAAASPVSGDYLGKQSSSTGESAKRYAVQEIVKLSPIVRDPERHFPKRDLASESEALGKGKGYLIEYRRNHPKNLMLDCSKNGDSTNSERATQKIETKLKTKQVAVATQKIETKSKSKEVATASQKIATKSKAKEATQKIETKSKVKEVGVSTQKIETKSKVKEIGVSTQKIEMKSKAKEISVSTQKTETKSKAKEANQKIETKSKAKEVAVAGSKSSKILIKLPPKNNKAEENPLQKEPLKIEDNAERNETQQMQEDEDKIWKLRPRKAFRKTLNASVGSVKNNGSAKMPDKSKTEANSKKSSNKSGENKGNSGGGGGEKKEKRKLSIEVALTKREIDEDIYALTGSKAARRPKKRAKNVQKQVDSVFPGLWLVSISADSYKVSESSLKG